MTPARASVARPRPSIPATENPKVVRLGSLPLGDVEGLRRDVIDRCKEGARLVALFVPPRATELVAVVARDDCADIAIQRAALAGPSYPALSSELPAAQAFEREILEVHGVRPEGHPWLKPLRRHDAHPFFQVDGPGIHEVAVGPVHAGIIEPGHFRFQCAGEKVLHLEIQLGYQHRGVERLMLSSSPARRIAIAEAIAGDTTIGHAIAHAAAVEALGAGELPLHAQAVRAVALELERLANHVGDLGALCNDVGYLPGASWLGRLRGEMLNALLVLSGNRFGRGLIRVGGVRFDLDSGQKRELAARLAEVERDLDAIVELVLDTPSVASRFEGTGVVSREIAEALGLVGPVARASGCDRDVRRDHPAGLYRFAQVPVAVTESGDVMARALVRALEIKRSLEFVHDQLREQPEGPARSRQLALEPTPARPDRLVVSLVEGWRGEIAHVAMTDADGAIAAYQIVDPSLHNWLGLAMALRDGEISDFPLCNKSFNLSYAGHDL
ncbi:MAG: NADH-quinone oxidoreductase subunit C [Deltaproteobacteria bacterium]|nr:NADH-quinone oxidoreductase subunit C [Deltaproteobacteria bacterium]